MPPPQRKTGVGVLAAVAPNGLGRANLDADAAASTEFLIYAVGHQRHPCHLQAMGGRDRWGRTGQIEGWPSAALQEAT